MVHCCRAKKDVESTHISFHVNNFEIEIGANKGTQVIIPGDTTQQNSAEVEVTMVNIEEINAIKYENVTLKTRITQEKNSNNDDERNKYAQSTERNDLSHRTHETRFSREEGQKPAQFTINALRRVQNKDERAKIEAIKGPVGEMWKEARYTEIET